MVDMDGRFRYRHDRRQGRALDNAFPFTSMEIPRFDTLLNEFMIRILSDLNRAGVELFIMYKRRGILSIS
jgi:hypothetical protein